MDFDEEALEVLGCQLYLSGEGVDGESIVLESISAVEDAFDTKGDLGLSKFSTKNQRYTITVSDRNLEPMYAGDFLELNFKVGEDVPTGTYTLTLTPAEINLRGIEVAAVGEKFVPSAETSFTVTIPARINSSITLVEPTGIEEVSTMDSNDDCYNLMGVNVKNYLQKGVYVKNGKKFIVK